MGFVIAIDFTLLCRWQFVLVDNNIGRIEVVNGCWTPVTFSMSMDELSWPVTNHPYQLTLAVLSWV